MVCPYCGGETDVTNSRVQKRNNQVWRRRQCRKCYAIFTTHEAPHLRDLFLVRNVRGDSPFSREKLFSDVLSCLKGAPDAYQAATELTATITQKTLKKASGGLILASDISFECAKTLKSFNRQAHLRYLAEHPSVEKKRLTS